MREQKGSDEGYIKFHCKLIKDGSPRSGKLTDLNKWRERLYDRGLIGMYDNGVGFGNISKRDGKEFIVSGTATGGLKKLKPEHYAVVTKYSLEDNSLECRGRVTASSESLTHAAVYAASPGINAVIHIHSLKAWKALINKVPTTAVVPYGTPEMAYEMLRLFRETDVEKEGLIVMAGHREGILTFGRNLDEAGGIILDRIVSLLQ